MEEKTDNQHRNGRETIKREIRALLMGHIAHVCQEHAAKPGYAVTLQMLKELLEQKLDYTVDTIDEQLFDTIGKRQHVFSSKSFEDLFLVISTLPAYKTEQAREFFAPAGYLRFLEERELHLAAQSGQCAAHWIFCFEPEGKRVMAHLTFFPDISQASQGELAFIFAHDLFTSIEKDSLDL